ncbi:enolase C-terminal domain-like protein [Streptomyces sp. NPDC006290]|uniref:enolase C-terminal domain-like protein n=1 Tax=Streptomyces sp. NPDC006290 TaxID=3156745 RepID=UPI0033A6F7EE
MRLLGGSRSHVPVYGSGGFTTYDQHQLGRQLCGWVEEQGIPRVKIKIGESWGSAEQRDRERIAQARRSIGDAAELYVDANGAYGRKQAIRVARHLDEFGVTWFEEPVSSDDLAGLAQVRASVAPEVTAGEYGYTLAYFGRMLGAGSVDCLQADATRCGGITVWLRAAALAEAAGLELSGHCAPHVHAAAAIPNLCHLEWFHDHTRIEGLFFDGTLDPQGGSVRPGATEAPQPVPPIYQPEVAARAVVNAADHPHRKQYYVGASTAAAILANKPAPALPDRYLARTGYASQQTDDSEPGTRTANLWHPADEAPEHDYGAHGSFDETFHPRSAQAALAATPRVCVGRRDGSGGGSGSGDTAQATALAREEALLSSPGGPG